MVIWLSWHNCMPSRYEEWVWITSNRASIKKVSALPVVLLFGGRGRVEHRQTDPCNSLVSQPCWIYEFQVRWEKTCREWARNTQHQTPAHLHTPTWTCTYRTHTKLLTWQPYLYIRKTSKTEESVFQSQCLKTFSRLCSGTFCIWCFNRFDAI